MCYKIKKFLNNNDIKFIIFKKKLNDAFTNTKNVILIYAVNKTNSV